MIAQLTLHWREDNIRVEGKEGQENICTFKWCKDWEQMVKEVGADRRVVRWKPAPGLCFTVIGIN